MQEDLQIWELVDPDSFEPVPPGARGLTVVTNLNSEGSPQLRFLVGDFATFDYGKCVCGRTFARARGGFNGRADDMLNIRGLKLFPSVVEEIVRGFDALGNEFQIVLETEGVMDAFTIVARPPRRSMKRTRIELRARLEAEIIRQCELRPRIQTRSARHPAPHRVQGPPRDRSAAHAVERPRFKVDANVRLVLNCNHYEDIRFYCRS